MAQEVSHILLPLFDKTLDMLHTSINSTLAQITTNAQKIVDMGTRLTTCENNLSHMDTIMS